MDNDHQKDLLQAMQSPSFYPHPVADIQVCETHISKVFLTGQWAYKVKKAVDFGFLDFSSGAKRHHFCRRECRLNRRLTRDIYHGVVPITWTDGRYQMAGQGKPVDYAVKMRQLPADKSLAYRLQQSELEAGFIEELADYLTTFYTRQRPCPNERAAAAYENLLAACENNFQQTRPFVGPILDPHLFAIIRSAMRAFLTRQGHLLRNRADGGWVRDVHGDLRTCHIYALPQSGIQVIDCIEFDDRLRQIDIVSDLAFLAMDFDAQGHSHLGSRLMAFYSCSAGDPGAYAVLPLYKCYRAMVRCKVNCLLLQSAATSDAQPAIVDHARRYLKLAYRYAVSFSRPKIWVFSGLPASGKSTVARSLSETLAAPHFRSDAVRRRVFRSHRQPVRTGVFNGGIYGKIAKQRTYGRLLGVAQTAIDRGSSVVIDATFNRPEYRREIKRLARDRHLRLTFIECRAPLDVMQARLQKRQQQPSLSQARLQDFEAFRKNFVPLGIGGMTAHMVLDTTSSPEECVRRILAEDHRVSTASMVSSLQGNEAGQGRMAPIPKPKGGRHVPIDISRHRSHQPA